MRAVFIAAGPGIEKGVTIDGVENTDVAPTVAKILGVPLPKASGRILSAIFEGGN